NLHAMTDTPAPINVRIRAFQPHDQAAAKDLILAGLEEHWGTLDPTRNPDLNDVAATYAGASFLLAVMRDDSVERIVGTGALKPHNATTGEIVRMSVAREARRRGIGRRILDALLDEARVRGMTRVILETTETWAGAIAFYLAAGFEITHYQDGDVYFSLNLTPDNSQHQTTNLANPHE
ncbi:MAG: GNAT family N-acetyltransferase, partial [Anaerolineae bacterium]|nr:GNAT family N-acetyltransferase [Anaerolineae bacterium]